jgi:hypothetical protein
MSFEAEMLGRRWFSSSNVKCSPEAPVPTPTQKKRQAKSDIEHIKEVINAPFYGQCPLNLIIVQIEVQGTN